MIRKLRLFGNRWLMSALPSKADICSAQAHVRFVPIADVERDKYWNLRRVMA